MPEEPDPPQPPQEAATQWMPPPSDGGSILPPAYAPLREVIGDFEIVAKIGQGGMGAVYRARQVSLDRQVALKLLPAQMVGDEEAVARFRREARVASSLRHPNLVAVYAAGEADGCHFIAMELIEGEDLGCRLKRGDPLTAPEALRVCAEVVRALEHGWRSAQLIHRDIKPSNIFLAADGAVKLGDLGLAKSLLGNSTGLTQTGAMMGTAQYMSPEQARGDRELDFRADIYSLGCTLYQMLTGQVPYRGSDAITIIRQHLDAPLPAIMKVWPQCPVPLARLVGRMLKKSRHERPASYAELLGQIDSVWAQIDPVGHSPEAFAPPPPHMEAEVTAPLVATPPAVPLRPPQSKNLLYAGIAAGVLVLAAVAFIFWPNVEPLTKAQIIAAQRAADAKASPYDPAVAAQTSEGGGSEKVGGEKTPLSIVPLAPNSTPAPLPANSPASHLSPSAEPWQDVLRDPAQLVLGSKVERTPEGLSFTDAGGAMRPPRRGPKRDGVVRMLATFGGLRPQLQVRMNAAGVYQLHAANKKAIALGRYDSVAKQWTVLREFPLREPLQPGQDYELELRAVGQTLTTKFNGEVLGTVADGTFPQGQFGVGVSDRDGAPALVKALEVLDLDAPSTR